MANKKLTGKEIATRMVELRNLRKLHTHDRQQIIELKAENKELRQLFGAAQEHLQTQAIQIAELQSMVFGRKKRPPTGGTPIETDPLFSAPPRTRDSYHRPVPPARAITNEVSLSLPDHCTCGGSFKDITAHVRYEEDIPLPDVTPEYRSKLVTKYVIERGVCKNCGKPTAARDLGGQAVSLGLNMRLLVSHLISVLGMSYAQAMNLLWAQRRKKRTGGHSTNTTPAMVTGVQPIESRHSSSSGCSC